MQFGVVYPLISRHKVVERQWARSTRDQKIPCSCIRVGLGKLAHCKELLRKTLLHEPTNRRTDVRSWARIDRFSRSPFGGKRVIGSLSHFVVLPPVRSLLLRPKVARLAAGKGLVQSRDVLKPSLALLLKALQDNTLEVGGDFRPYVGNRSNWLVDVGHQELKCGRFPERGPAS
jgi:hypothetical protein